MKILIIGDMHGNFNAIDKMFDIAVDANISTILQLGDFASFGKHKEEYLRFVSYHGQQNDINIYFIDGNHDDHLYYNHLTELQLNNKTDLEFIKVYDNLYYIPRGFCWEWDGIKFVGLGGAFSLDFESRVLDVNLSREENITLGQAYQACQGGPADILISHDVPYGVTMKSRFTLSPALQNMTDANRLLLRQVVDNVRPKVVYHGHWHQKVDSVLTLNDGYKVDIHGLGFELYKSCTILDTEIFKDQYGI